MKLESNIQNLNRDLANVNEEIEQMKRLLFPQLEGPKMLPISESQPLKRQLEPLTARCFKTDEELLDYYDMKAVDPYDRCEEGDEDHF
jgi:hypothetical protein